LVVWLLSKVMLRAGKKIWSWERASVDNHESCYWQCYGSTIPSSKTVSAIALLRAK